MKRKKHSRQVLILVITIFLFVLLAILTLFVIIFTAQIYKVHRNDSFEINLAGRQRMLTQKITKQVLLFNGGLLNSSEIKTSIDMFEKNLDVLINGGDSYIDQTQNRTYSITMVRNADIFRQLEQIKKEWVPFRDAVLRFIENRDPGDFQYIIERNVQLLQKVDQSVLSFQNISENRAELSRRIFTIVVLILMVAIILFTVLRILQLQKTIKHLRELEHVLPICSHCKKIHRIDEKNGVDTWISIEEYMDDNDQNRLSHGICPECMVKYYKKYM